MGSLAILRTCQMGPCTSRMVVLQTASSRLFHRSGLGKGVKQFLENTPGISGRTPMSFFALTWRDFKLFTKLARPHRGRILVGLGCLFVSTSAFLAVPRILGQFIDASTAEHHEGEEGRVNFLKRLEHVASENMWTVLALLVVGASAFAARVYLLSTAGQLMTNDLRRSTFSSLMAQDASFFDQHRASEIVARMSSASFAVGRTMSKQLAEGVRGLIVGVGTVALMTASSPSLTLTTLFAAPIILGIFIVYGRRQFVDTANILDSVNVANACALERLTKIEAVRAMRSEHIEKRVFADRLQDIWSIAERETRTRAVLQGLFQFTGYATFTFVLYHGVGQLSSGALTFGDLSSFCLYYAIFSKNVMSVAETYTEFMKTLGSSSKLFSLNLQKPRSDLKGGLVVNDLKKGIQFDNVVFSYKPELPKVLNGVSFEIPAKKVTAIVGRTTHSGRSTLAKLLLRLYEPVSGEIRVDGVSLPSLELDSWRRNIAFVRQEPIFFPATIRDNLVYGLDREVPKEEIDEAVEFARCEHFIQLLPQGIETPLSDSTLHLLSAGQRKRLAIARAIIKKTPILILDDTTSGVDAASEKKIGRVVRKLLERSRGQQTVFVLANRIPAVQHADQILVLDHGRVSEVGTFDELMRKQDGLFRALMERQTIKWDEA